MKIALSDKRSCLVLTGNVHKGSQWAQINSLSDLIYGGKITGFNSKNGRYEIAGESLNGRPVFDGDICRNCPHIWKNCNTCSSAMREPQWFVLPEDVTLQYSFAKH